MGKLLFFLGYLFAPATSATLDDATVGVGLEMGGVMQGNCLPYSIRIAIISYLPLPLLRFR